MAQSCSHRHQSQSQEKITRDPTASTSLLSPTRPDAGYAWVIVLCGFLLYFIVDGIAYNLGLVNSEWLKEFEANETATSWIGSIFYATPLLTAPVTAQLVESFDCRTITIVFGLIAALGFVASSFAVSVTELYVTFGLISGFGVSAAYVVGILAVERWFERKRTLAIGLVSAGTGVGTVILPPATQAMLKSHGWRVTMLFLASLVGLMSVIGFYILEPGWATVSKNQDEENQRKIPSVRGKLKRMFLHFANVNFDLLALSTFVIYAIYNAPIYFMEELLKTLDYSDNESAGCISLIGFFLTCGMVTLGVLGDLCGQQIKLLNTACVLVCGLSITAIPTAAVNGFALSTCCAVFGFTFASAYVLIPKIAELIVGVDEFPSALGLNFFVQGLGCLVGPPFASALFELLESWPISFEICGCVLTVSCIFAFMIQFKK